jgi:GMP synthase (glutamine-hydrolysing)
MSMLHAPIDRPVLIVQHEAAAHPGTLLETFVNAGLTVDVRQLHAGTGLPAPAELGDHAALVVLGGSMNVDQARRFPFIAEEQRLLRAALAADVPLLGICLGGQQLAAAIGGTVYQRPEPEVGWLPVEIGRRDALFSGIASPFCALEWHAQSFTVPAEAEVLAMRDGDSGVQAFRVGRRAWGLQFHAEVDESMLAHWIRRDNKGMNERDPEILACLHRLMPDIVAESRDLCRRLVTNFVSAI